MNVITLLVQFGGVFAAAFLAFLFENVRERRRTTRWVSEHLAHLSELLTLDATEKQEQEVSASVERHLLALDAWLAAREPSDVSDDDWRVAFERFYTSVPDLGAVLRSEALTVVPQHVALSLNKLEQEGAKVKLLSEAAMEARRDVAPAWYEKQVPLTIANANRVRALQSVVRELMGELPNAFRVMRDVNEAIVGWRWRMWI